MFRFRQAFRPSFSNTILLENDLVLENGIVERKSVDASSIVLPDAENYDLEVLLNAGVPLKQVNCKLLSPSSASFAFDEDKTDNVESADNKEN